MVAARRPLDLLHDILGDIDLYPRQPDNVVLYETIVKAIDWARILIEASSRHQSLPDHKPWTFLEGNEICPDCVRAVLLTYDEAL